MKVRRTLVNRSLPIPLRGQSLVRCACVAVAIVLAGCATQPERFMTQEQDELFAKNCADGCAVVPAPIWQQILERLHRQGGI